MDWILLIVYLVGTLLSLPLAQAYVNHLEKEGRENHE